MSQGKVSIIIPVYNTADYIERCVRSVMAQTYSDLEIICVNDGSSDRSGEILDELAKEDERIIVVHKANAGVSAARNEALFKVSGDFITFVDSDDYIDARMYEKMLDKMSEECADIVTCGYSFDYEGDIRKAENLKEVPEYAIPMKEFLLYIYERDTYKGVGGYLWTRMIKREVIFGEEEKPQICFGSQYGVGEDIVFVAELSIRCKRIAYLEDSLYFYFQREGSIVHDDKKQLETLQWLKSYEKIIEIYISAGIEDVIDIIIRMYVYRCGKTLELAVKYNDKQRADIIKQKIKRYLDIYIRTNEKHPERVQWIEGLLEAV